VKHIFETTVRVRYAETDQLGVVYHSNFFIWFEVGRVELLRQAGFSYKEMEQKDDSHIVVAEARCTYKKPARYDDVLRIRTRVAGIRTRSIRFAYEVLNQESGNLLATARPCTSFATATAGPRRCRKNTGGHSRLAGRILLIRPIPATADPP